MQQSMVICVDGICDNLKKNTRGNCRTIVNLVCFYDARTNMEEKLRVLRMEYLISNYPAGVYLLKVYFEHVIADWVSS